MPNPVLRPFLIDGHHFEAEDLAQGFLVNPVLPECFDTTPNEERSQHHMAMWWERPFIERSTSGQSEQYTVRCLDGGAWDRSTWWGNSATLEGALDLAENGPLRRRK